MTRKPIHLSATGPRGDRQAMWEILRALHQAGDSITIPDVRGRFGGTMPAGRVRDYLVSLEAAGYLKRNEEPRKGGEPVRYRLVRDVGVEAPRVTRDGRHVTQGAGREQLWRTMRIIGEFNHRELAVHASTEAQPVAENEAAYYCQYLARAGYLVTIVEGGPNRPARYRLLPSRYTGPRAPQIQRIRQVWDANKHEVVWRPEDDRHE